ncbi:hypothetical protein AB9G23_09770 [Francisella philomiragia]|uniref:hypothetical protein n=1 Tax=Francisella philomiragia TaxID=28110 RepID=UPI001907F290|nr:hypothetical protein [Francisella philomiragia]MBK2024764.1 hypothetical protein [Francisella philomiragia]
MKILFEEEIQDHQIKKTSDYWEISDQLRTLRLNDFLVFNRSKSQVNINDNSTYIFRLHQKETYSLLLNTPTDTLHTKAVPTQQNHIYVIEYQQSLFFFTAPANDELTEDIVKDIFSSCIELVFSAHGNYFKSKNSHGKYFYQEKMSLSDFKNLKRSEITFYSPYGQTVYMPSVLSSINIVTTPYGTIKDNTCVSYSKQPVTYKQISGQEEKGHFANQAYTSFLGTEPVNSDAIVNMLFLQSLNKITDADPKRILVSCCIETNLYQVLHTIDLFFNNLQKIHIVSCRGEDKRHNVLTEKYDAYERTESIIDVVNSIEIHQRSPNGDNSRNSLITKKLTPFYDMHYIKNSKASFIHIAGSLIIDYIQIRTNEPETFFGIPKATKILSATILIIMLAGSHIDDDSIFNDFNISKIQVYKALLNGRLWERLHLLIMEFFQQNIRDQLELEKFLIWLANID